ncbi:MAG: FlhC family transcriptional regulator [Gammaproteobacteria bacterium]|nr:FlhC family transcriptional regulator [Gammaproteobacteria bacterium]
MSVTPLPVSPRHQVACPSGCAHRECDVELFKQAIQFLEAIELVRLGGRAGLVRQLTRVEKKTVNRLYRQLHGTASPPGQAPFTDAWYIEDDRRMLHATVVWRVDQRLCDAGRSDARRLIDVYRSYRCIVGDPLLDLTRAAFVPRLVDMETWQPRVCEHCDAAYIASLVSPCTACPGCRLYHRYRCRHCQGPLNAKARGRPRRACGQCQ